MARSVLGLDVGGANLKAAHTNGSARSRPFALWKAPAALPDALRELLRDWPSYDALAVTMTGELCDCFATKREGVNAILDAVSAVSGGVPVRVWRNDGRLVDLAAARRDPLLVASANWLALATFAGRQAPRGPALLIDIGSTTTDIVPLLDGRPVPRGRTDTERLHASELAYTGVIRTPLCAILATRGMAEFFATTRDVFLILGRLPEDPSDCDTADGRPATRSCAEARIARMIGADRETSTAEERQNVVNFALLRQVMFIGGCIETVAKHLARLPETIILSGVGEFLAQMVLSEQKTVKPCPVVSLSQGLGPEVSKAACAYALAMIAAEGAMTTPFVVKVGGSLFNLPDLRVRLESWLRSLGRREVLVVPGGGAAADMVRAADRVHHLGEESSHWLALRSLSLTAHLLAALTPYVVIEHLENRFSLWAQGVIPILDPLAFMLDDEGQPDYLPHHWDVTSDSLAARVAEVMQARELILLKSVTIPPEIDWAEASRRGLVDAYFPKMIVRGVNARAVNLRDWRP